MPRVVAEPSKTVSAWPPDRQPDRRASEHNGRRLCPPTHARETSASSRSSPSWRPTSLPTRRRAPGTSRSGVDCAPRSAIASPDSSRATSRAAREPLHARCSCRAEQVAGGSRRHDPELPSPTRRAAGSSPPSVSRFVVRASPGVSAAFVSARSRGPPLGRASRPPGPLRGCPASAFPVSPEGTPSGNAAGHLEELRGARLGRTSRDESGSHKENAPCSTKRNPTTS